MARGRVSAPLIRAEGLSRGFRTRGAWRGREILAVRVVDLAIDRGEAVGVVGESGCGKSTLGRLLLRLLPPSAGRILFDGSDLATLGGGDLRRLRRRMQLIFQDPYGSLDPRRRIGDQIADGMLIHRLADRPTARDRVAALLRQVGLEPRHADRLPHEFSGGQRQRIAIARALATGPDFVVADEPVSALDMSVQAQVVNLLADLRAELGLALLFISHDLPVVRHLADRVVVMYLGRIVEIGPTAAVFAAPAHPYTRALLAATPSLERAASRTRHEAAGLAGEPPDPAAPPSGCGFRTRCPHAVADCAAIVPPLRPVGTARQAACIRDDVVGV
jgi:oligopeptide/dipeptide ABC transporter ATP-binding protein